MVKWDSKVVKWGSGDVKLGSEVVKWSGLVETQKFRTCVFFCHKIYLILLLKTSSDPSYYFSNFKTCGVFFGSRIYLILLLKTSSDLSYYFSKVPNMCFFWH